MVEEENEKLELLASRIKIMIDKYGLKVIFVRHSEGVSYHSAPVLYLCEKYSIQEIEEMVISKEKELEERPMFKLEVLLNLNK